MRYCERCAVADRWMVGYKSSNASVAVSVCQIDIELHAPDMPQQFAGSMQSLDEFDGFYRTFLRDTNFVPVIADVFLSHRKVTLVDPSLDYCNDYFDFDRYL